VKALVRPSRILHTSTRAQKNESFNWLKPSLGMQSREQRVMAVKRSSLLIWFSALFLLNVLDVATTIPVWEVNPITLFLWSGIGGFLSAWVKLGLVLLFGALCMAAWKVASAQEWLFAKKVFRGVLIVLVAYYVFVVANNVRIVLLCTFT
jgi:hypothetical protein